MAKTKYQEKTTDFFLTLKKSVVYLLHPVKTKNIILSVRFQQETDDTLEKGNWREYKQNVSKKTARDDAVPLPTCGQCRRRKGNKYTGLSPTAFWSFASALHQIPS